MYNLNWSRESLTRQKLGKFCEYYAKMALSSYGLDIYTSEVDDHGIDFVAETKNGFLKFQVKSIRENTHYVFMKQKHFDITDSSLYLLLVYLVDGKHPQLYLIPATQWSKENNKLFVSYSYEEKKSEAEYGLNLSKKNMNLLIDYEFDTILEQII